MRCQRCQFENVPGESRCFKCGSILSGQSVTVDVHPPRMGKFARPFRAVFRRLRTWQVLPDGGIQAWFPDWLKIMSWNAFFAIALSIAPGLAHLAQGRFRQIRWYFVGWVVFISVGMFLYGSNLGFLLVGLAVAAHAWIAFDASLIKEHSETGPKAFDIVMLLVFFAFIYWGVRVVAFRDFVWGYTSITIPYQSVQSGDLLLARYSLAQTNPLPRGSLVLVPLAHTARGEGRMLVQIVGLPGERIKITDAAFFVDGKTLDVERFPVPEWLQGHNIAAIAVPEDSYFISTVYNVTIRGNRALDTGLVAGACLVKFSEVQARAIMRWFPLARRGFLRPYE